MIVLVLGGIRSGKSDVAERLAARLADGGAVTYLATAIVDPADTDHVARVEQHRRRRPPTWATLEVGRDLAAALGAVEGTVLVESLGSWVGDDPDRADTAELLAALEARRAPTVVVSEEVGLSIHAPSALGRRFVDVLGALNRGVAERAARVLLVVAGRVLELPPAADEPGPPPC